MNDFNSHNNEKVINIAENNGDIFMGGKETPKNDVDIKNEGIYNSVINNVVNIFRFLTKRVL